MEGRQVIMLVLCPMIIIGNGLLLVFLAMLLAGRGCSRDTAAPMTHTRFLLLHLALSDFLIGCMILPMVISAEQKLVEDAPWLCLVSVCLTMMSISVSSFLLIAIGIERYLAILHPLRYQSLVTAGRVIFVGFMCWSLGIMLGLAPLCGWNTLVGWRSEVCNRSRTGIFDETTPTMAVFPTFSDEYFDSYPSGLCKFTTVLPGSYTGLFFLGFNLPLWVCMIGLNGHIMIEAQRQARQTAVMMASSSASQTIYNMEKANYKAIRLITAIVANYLLAWAPVVIYYSVMYDGFTEEVLCDSESSRLPYWTYLLVTCMLYGSSAVNPWIYGLGDKHLREIYLATWVGRNLRKLHNHLRSRSQVGPMELSPIDPIHMMSVSSQDKPSHIDAAVVTVCQQVL